MLENTDNRFFHVTDKENLNSILQNGLIPQIGARAKEIGETAEAIYLFSDHKEMNNALYNWLGEAFDETDVGDLILIQIDFPKDKAPKADDFYETVYYDDIPVEYMTFYDEYENRLDISAQIEQSDNGGLDTAER